MNRLLLLLTFLFLTCSCYRVPDSIEPKISFSREYDQIQSLSSPFDELTPEEKESSWGKEYIIAQAFAKEYDLYRAVSTFKRAKILIPRFQPRLQEIEYFTLLSFYLADKFSEALDFFESSTLYTVDREFAAYQDLLIILYECYLQQNDSDKAEKALTLLQDLSPQIQRKANLSWATIKGDLQTVSSYAEDPQHYYIQPFLKTYEANKKSVFKAQLYNALLPGSGYYYLGLKKTAATSLLINSLFTYAAYHFFSHKNYAAGAIAASFEAGWYFGGVYGAGEQARYYNERVYEKLSYQVMEKERLFPAFMLQFGF